MRSGYASLAVVGVAACVAVYAFTYLPQTTNLQVRGSTPMSHEDYEFFRYIAKYGKDYATKEEFDFRNSVFQSNLRHIVESNSRNDLTFSLGINKFADMTNEEFRKRLGRKKNQKLRQSTDDYTFLDEAAIPASVDWRQKGAVNPVQDQGQCGSCWAFSATSAIESAHFIASGKLLKLSEQQFVDCAGGVYQNEGCNGGDETSAMQYAMKYAVELENTYPYTAEDDSCTWSKSEGKVLVTKVTNVPPNNAQQLMAAIAKTPVTVAVEADTNFQFYTGGILNSQYCGTNLDHAILAVGYDQKGAFYIVRNSWGADWGENGYIRLAITGNDAGICGVQSDPSWPITN